MTDDRQKLNNYLMGSGAALAGYNLLPTPENTTKIHVDLKKSGTGRTAIFATDGTTGSGHLETARSLQNYIGKDKSDVHIIEDFVNPDPKSEIRQQMNMHLGRGAGIDTYKMPKIKGKILDFLRKRKDSTSKANAIDSLRNSEYIKFEQLFNSNLDIVRLKDTLNKGGYDRIIVTQARPGKVLNQRLGIKPEFLVSDYGNTKSWTAPASHMSRVYITPENERDLRESQEYLDLPKSKRAKFVTMPSIPIRPEFFEPSTQSAQIKSELGLHPTKKNILLFGGGSGTYLSETTENIAPHFNSKKYQINVITGKNNEEHALVKQLLKKYKHVNILHDSKNPYPESKGFHTRIKDVMANSDLNLIRTGGPSLTEAMAIGQPYAGFVTNKIKDEVGKQIVRNIELTDSKMVNFRDKEDIKSFVNDYIKDSNSFKPKSKIVNAGVFIAHDTPKIEVNEFAQAHYVAPKERLLLDTIASPFHGKLNNAIYKLRIPGLIGTGLLTAGIGKTIYDKYKKKAQ